MNSFQPARLKEACMDCRIRAVDLAEKTGISKTTISNLINGKIQQPQRETIANIAWALRKPERYFYTPIVRNYIDTTEPTYRSFSSRANLDNLCVAAKLLKLKDVVQYLYEFIEERDIDVPSELIIDHGSAVKDPDYIESLALKLREYWGLGQSAIDNITVLLENHGIVCSKLEMPGKIESVNSCSRFRDSEQEVAFAITSIKTTYFRQRFTLAHELGHIILHHYLDAEDYIADSKSIEDQADYFASAFLMPYQSFLDSVYKRTFSELMMLKKKWGVSMAACARRMRDLFLISENQYQTMNIELSRKGWRKREPLDDDIVPEKPYYIEAGYRFLFDNKIISSTTVVNNFNLFPDELADYIGNEDILLPQTPNIEYRLR